MSLPKYFLILLSFLVFNVQGIDAKPASLKIVTTFSILGDLVREIGKDKVVISIVGPNSDTHTYQPTPKDVREISKADLVFINGLGFEGWIHRLIESSGYKGEILEATKGVKPIMINDPGEGEVPDPHAWNDIENVKIYVRNIYEALCSMDPEEKEFYRKNYEDYLNKLQEIDDFIVSEIKKIPEKRRVIITAHDAFGYYGKRYGLRFLAPVGTSTADEPSPKAMASLIDTIKKNQIKIIFTENITNKKLIKQISEETGIEIGEEIFSDALSEEDQPGPTYLKMMRHNTDQFLKSMHLSLEKEKSSEES
ncbi:MAG: metal ABC transporter substrate-binding protein [Rickettsiales bacterium]|nr:metal ABC transporter substrate-binding protein [Rickettsiales bacterium]|tara:strand:+ start:7878 stop:8804 length:927 start_codon:yes stop_codon:yes gene_type:complete